MHLSELCKQSNIEAVLSHLRQVASRNEVQPFHDPGVDHEDDEVTAAGPSDFRELLSYQDNDGRTALHWAVALKNFELARKLMGAPYDSPVFTQDEQWSTPFATACNVSAPLDLVQNILEKSVAELAERMAIMNAHGSPSSIDMATIEQAEGMQHDLATVEPLKGGGDPPVTAVPSDSNGVTLPMDSSPASLRSAVVNAQDKTGQTPLLLSVGRGYTAIVRFLLDNGADMRHQNRQKQTVLHRAVSRGNTELVELLVQTSEKNHAGNMAAHRRWMDTQDRRGDSALFYASSDNNEELGRYLLRHGADRELRNAEGKAFWEV